MVIYLLCGFLFAELVLTFIIMDKDLFSPAVIFNTVFFFASLDLLTMRQYWVVELHINTLCVITGSVMMYSLTSFIAKPLKFRIFSSHRYRFTYMAISNLNLLMFLAINSFIVLYVSRAVANVVRNYGYSGNLLSLIGRYSTLGKDQHVDVGIGKIASNLHQFCEAQSTIWGYLLIKEFLYRKKFNLGIFVNYVITSISYFLYGSRGMALFVVISLIPTFVILFREKRNGRLRIPRKYYRITAIIVLLLFLGFQGMGSIMNRNFSEDTSLWEYVSIYLGAPIRNLDSFLQESHVSPRVWGYNTFAVQLNYLGAKLGISEWQNYIDIPFREINGHTLGNVYTTFYSYIYDWGYIGLIAIPIMAFFMQLLYNQAVIQTNKTFPIMRMMYIYMFPTIVFSFFSNKFFEAFSITFFKTLLYWMIFPVFLLNSYRYSARNTSSQLQRQYMSEIERR